MKNKYYLLDKKKKMVAWFAAIIVSLIIASYFNSDFMQARMFGSWDITESEIQYEVDSIPKSVNISSGKIDVDGQKIVGINYLVKPSKRSIKRINKGDEIYYYFKKRASYSKYYDYLIIYNKKNRNQMTFVTFSTEDNQAVENIYLLERSED